MSSALSAMDFSNAGTTERVGVSFRAHVQWNDKGKQNAYGPNRKDKETAQEDLESMRAAASGKSREDGFASMKVEADRLKAEKALKEEGLGSVEVFEMGFRASIQWRDEGGSKIPARGPRRAEKRRAEEDLEVKLS